MDEDTRTEWYKAAWIALEGIPTDLLFRGAKAALATADHPSKIVAAITKEVGKTWEDRRGMVSRMQRTNAEVAAQIEANKRLKLEPPAEQLDALGGAESTADILKRIWPGMAQHEPGYQAGKLNLDPDRECRKPTRADYLALGVAPEALDAMGLE